MEIKKGFLNFVVEEWEQRVCYGAFWLTGREVDGLVILTFREAGGRRGILVDGFVRE